MSEILEPGATHNLQPDELGAQIQLANLALSRIQAEQPVPIALREKIESTLDASWPYGDAACAFSGLCQVVESHPTESRLTEDFFDVQEGVSGGFYVIKFGRPGKQQWTTAWGFHAWNTADLGEEPVRTDFFVHTAARYAIVPIAEIEEAFPEDLYFPDLYNTLSQYSDDLARDMQDDSFFYMTAEEQKYFIDISLDTANATAEEHRGIKGRPIGIDSTYGYVLAGSESGDYEPINTAEVCVKGQCDGLMVLARRQLAQGRQIAGPEDLVHIGSGMCLIVRVDEATAKRLQLSEAQELYIPISGQDIQAHFDSQVIEMM